jgi:hypothetical protein
MPEWWDIEAEFYVNKHGIDPDKARAVAMFRWLWHGDLRPLEAAISEGRPLPQCVLNLLADMIADGRLRVAGRRGRPKKPERSMRDYVAALAYEREDGASNEAFDRIAKLIGKSDRTVRQAVTAWRKHDN